MTDPKHRMPLFHPRAVLWLPCQPPGCPQPPFTQEEIA